MKLCNAILSNTIYGWVFKFFVCGATIAGYGVGYALLYFPTNQKIFFSIYWGIVTIYFYIVSYMVWVDIEKEIEDARNSESTTA